MYRLRKRKERRGIVTILGLEAREVDCPPALTGGRAGLEPPDLKAEFAERIRQGRCPAIVLAASLPAPQSSTPLTTFVSVSAGSGHTCGLTDRGGVMCWGSNFNGQLGDGTTTDRYMPVDVKGLHSGVKAVSAGTTHTCALLTTGGVKCWGNNNRGQLGDGTKINRWIPVDVIGLTSGVASIEAGGLDTCAVTIHGGAKCWGSNQRGRLGDGTTIDRSTPANVIGEGELSARPTDL